MKVCDLYKHPDYEKEVLTEVAVYNALKAFQGLCIPRLNVAGYHGLIFVIATEISGSPLEVDKLNHRFDNMALLLWVLLMKIIL